MKPTEHSIERRREPRLPFGEKVIFANGRQNATAHAANVSRGGMFVMTLEPFPIDSYGYLAFLLPGQPTSMCVRVKVAHIVFDKQRCEVECGMGIQFLELSQAQKNILDYYLNQEQAAYLELRELLAVPRPDFKAVSRLVKRLPELEESDLMALRYRVNRICTLFDSFPRVSESA